MVLKIFNFCQKMLGGKPAIRQFGNQIRILRVKILGNSATILACLAFSTFILKATFVMFLDKKLKKFRCAAKLSLYSTQNINFVKKFFKKSQKKISAILEFSAFILQATLVMFLATHSTHFARRQSCFLS